MNPGNFSLSLSVKDIAASRAFYVELGLAASAGDADQGWLIMKGPTCMIGLFQGMFDRNMLTFNPGWDSSAQPVEDFTDVREIQKRLRAAGATFVQEADETTTGPDRCMVLDPDGNPVLFDQHV